MRVRGAGESPQLSFHFFFFNDTAPTEIYTLSLHDALPIPIFLMIQYLGLVNSYLGLILPYIAFSLPLVVWIMIGFFDEIPREIDEAAMVDGLTRPQVLLRVLLPLARPGMLVAATFGVIFVWNEFLVGLFIINSQDKDTIPIAASSLLTVE